MGAVWDHTAAIIRATLGTRRTLEWGRKGCRWTHCACTAQGPSSKRPRRKAKRALGDPCEAIADRMGCPPTARDAIVAVRVGPPVGGPSRRASQMGSCQGPVAPQPEDLGPRVVQVSERGPAPSRPRPVSPRSGIEMRGDGPRRSVKSGRRPRTAGVIRAWVPCRSPGWLWAAVPACPGSAAVWGKRRARRSEARLPAGGLIDGPSGLPRRGEGLAVSWARPCGTSTRGGLCRGVGST